MQLEDMNKDELIALVKRQEQELAAQPVQQPAPVLSADDVQWVTNDNAELGVKIGKQFFFLYKGESLVYDSGMHDDGSPMMYRPVFKREFGECAHPINHNDYSKIGTVSLSDSEEWKAIDAAPVAAPVAMPAASVQPEIERKLALNQVQIDGLHHEAERYKKLYQDLKRQPDIGRDAALVMPTKILREQGEKTSSWIEYRPKTEACDGGDWVSFLRIDSHVYESARVSLEECKLIEDTFKAVQNALATQAAPDVAHVPNTQPTGLLTAIDQCGGVNGFAKLLGVSHTVVCGWLIGEKQAAQAVAGVPDAGDEPVAWRWKPAPPARTAKWEYGDEVEWFAHRSGYTKQPLYTRPQPAPAVLTHDQIRQIFIASGFTIKEGQTDLKDYVYKAAYAVLSAAAK